MEWSDNMYPCMTYFFHSYLLLVRTSLSKEKPKEVPILSLNTEDIFNKGVIAFGQQGSDMDWKLEKSTLDKANIIPVKVTKMAPRGRGRHRPAPKRSQSVCNFLQ